MKNILIGLLIVLIGLTVGWYVSRPNRTFPQVGLFRKQTTTPTIIPTSAPYVPLAISITGSPVSENVTKGGIVLKQTVATSQVVSYADDGFHQSILYVKLGTTVTFRNDSTHEMWVASAPHPTHTAYPEFDQKKSVRKGDVYQFTFTKVGAWKYHNHMVPDQTGTVVVTQ